MPLMKINCLQKSQTTINQCLEEEFLNQKRPLRNESRYYLGIVEDDPANTTEPFGMYGNRGLLWTDSIGICVFGNKRIKSNVGWDNYNDKNIHVFDEEDTHVINRKMPEEFFPCLLDILNRNKQNFEATYRELNYDNEISFEEFFIFWYHWIYSEVADVLIAKVRADLLPLLTMKLRIISQAKIESI